MRFIVKIILNAVALWLMTLILAGHVVVTSFGPEWWQNVLTYLLVALIFGIVNGIIGTIVKIVAFPLYILTLGLISIIVNGLLLWFVNWLSTLVGFGLTVVPGWPRRLLVGRARRARPRHHQLDPRHRVPPARQAGGAQPLMALPPQPLSPLDGRYAPRRRRARGAPLRSRPQPRPRPRRGRVAAAAHRPEALRRRAAASGGEGGAPGLGGGLRRGRDRLARGRGGAHAPRRQGGRVPDPGEAGGARARPVAELVHFACTSEDINNLAYAITIRDAVERRLAAEARRAHRRAREARPGDRRRRDARPHARAAGHADDDGQGARRHRRAPEAPARAAPPRSSRSGSSTARRARTQHTSRQRRTSTGRPCRSASSPPSASHGIH